LDVAPWVYDVGRTTVRLLPVIALIAWCLWGVNWRKAWPILAEGAWVPLVLIAGFAGFVWSQVFPMTVLVLGFIPMPNVVWQLAAVALLVGLVLFCGWLQTVMNWYPPDVNFDPPVATDPHGHGHDTHDSHAAPVSTHASH
jgi:hypothetical protein